MLPKINIPKYSTTLPISGKVIEYRPYIVKEQNILKYAAQSGEESDIEDAIKQIIGNCSGVDVSDIHPTDFEWLFLKIHACSESNIVEVIYPVEDCAELQCPSYVSGYFDINEVTVIKQDKANPFKSRGNGFIIPVDDNIGMHLKKIVVFDENDYQTLYNALISIYDGDKIFPKSSIDYNEFIDFIDNLPKPVSEQLKQFMEYVGPTIQCNVNGKCDVCGKVFYQQVEGLKDFFV
jgi:hypothetical protein